MRLLVYNDDTDDFTVHRNWECLNVPEPCPEDDPEQVDDSFLFWEEREIADLIRREPQC